jgi:hypothetical protein
MGVCGTEFLVSALLDEEKGLIDRRKRRLKCKSSRRLK